MKLEIEYEPSESYYPNSRLDTPAGVLEAIVEKFTTEEDPQYHLSIQEILESFASSLPNSFATIYKHDHGFKHIYNALWALITVAKGQAPIEDQIRALQVGINGLFGMMFELKRPHLYGDEITGWPTSEEEGK